MSPEAGARVLVRLLATPARIKRELGENDSLELGILRAMWRVAGDALNDGAPIDLDGLPPGFGGGSGAMPLLDALRDRQFVEWKRLGGGAALAKPGKPLTAFPIDWATIDRRRRADLQKLDAMQQYAYTKGCRRGFVLRYFGDPRGALVLWGLRQLPRHARRGREGRSARRREERRRAEASGGVRLATTASGTPTKRRCSPERTRRCWLASAICGEHFARGAGSGLRSFPGSHARRDGRATPDDERRAGRTCAASVRRSSRSTAIVFSP